MKEQISASNPKPLQQMEHPIFLSDEPCTQADKIRFGHEAYVEAIQDAVATCPTPFAIGLYGKWGTGKTTVLQALKSRLHNKTHSGRHFRVCLFDAWKYSEEASFRRQFLAVLNEQLDLHWDLDKLLYRPKEEQKFDVHALLRNLWIVPLTVAVIAGVVSVTYWIAGRLGGTEIANSILSGAIAGILGILLFVVGVVFDVVKMSAYRVTQPLLFAPEQFEGEFTHMLRKAGVSDARCLVILVDNLDRCAPDAAVGTLRTIKTFLEHEGCVFVVACDEEALVSHLTKEGDYKEEADAKEFLRKFFQATIRVEPLLADLRDFASEQVAVANLQSDVARVVYAASPRDPRRIIQFLNRLTLVLYLLQARESSGRLPSGEVASRQAYLAKILLINELWPRFTKDCLIHPELLALADQCIGQQSPVEEYPPLQQYFGSSARQTKDYAGLYEFLQSTLDIKVEDPRPFLSLQRSAVEMGIAEPLLFKDMLRLGRLDEVRSQLSQVTDGVHLQNYKEIIARTIEEELNRARLLDAISACRVTIACFDLLPEPRRDVANMVSRTVTNASPKEDIPTLDQSSLLRCMAEASGGFVQPAMTRVIESLETDRPHTADFFNALPRHTPELNEEGYAAIASFLLGSMEAMPDVALGYLTVIAPGSSLANNLFRSKPELLAQVAEGVALPDAPLADKMLETFGDYKDHATDIAMDALCGQIIALLNPPMDTRPAESTQRALAALEHLSMQDIATERIDGLLRVMDKVAVEVPSFEEKLHWLVHCLRIYPWVSEQGEVVTNNTLAGFSSAWPPDKLVLLRDVIYATDLEAIKLTFLGTVKNRVLAPQTPIAVKDQILSLVFPISDDLGVIVLTDVLKAMLQMPDMPEKEVAARSVLRHRDALLRDTIDQLVQAIYDKYMAVSPSQGEPLLGPLLQLIDMRTSKELRNKLADRLKGELGHPGSGRRNRAALHYADLRTKLSRATRSMVAQDVASSLYDRRHQLTLDDSAVFDIVLEEQGNRIPLRTWEFLGNTLQSLLRSDRAPEIRRMACDLIPGFDRLPKELHDGILEELDTIVKDEGLPQELRDAASLAIDHIG